LQAIIHNFEQLAPQDQLQLADHIEQWLEDVEWRRVVNEPGPDALYDAAREEMRQGQTRPLRPEDFAEKDRSLDASMDRYVPDQRRTETGT
jgi:hypothetical protein